MKNSFTILCGALALLCLLSLFIPVVAPRYSTAEYHPGSGDYTKDYFLMGDYYYARQYWSVARFALSCGHRIALSITAALLLYWATMNLMGEETRFAGMLAATANLCVTAYLMVKMLRVAAGCRWGLIIVVGMDVVVAFAVAWLRFLTGREKRYIKLPFRKKQ